MNLSFDDIDATKKVDTWVSAKYELLGQFKKQFDEWEKISKELASRATVTPCDVTAEQDRRLGARGERRITYKECHNQFHAMRKRLHN